MEERIVVKLFSDVGMGELFMARLFHLKDRILSGVFGLERRKEVEDTITGLIFDGLEPAFRSLRELRKEWVDDKVPEKKKRQHIENVYSYLTIAYKDRLQQVAKEFGYDIGFVFQKDARFTIGSEAFIVQYPKIGVDFIRMITDDRDTWLTHMISVRNDAIDHAAGKDREIIKELQKSMNLEETEKIFDNCWKSIEDIILMFALDKTDEKYGQRILELKEYRLNPDHPERLGWFLIPGHPANRNVT